MKIHNERKWVKIFRAMMDDSKKIMSDFKVVIASVPHRENCVCEIFYKQVQWAEISQENTEVMIQFYPHPRDEHWEFPVDIAVEVLQKAKKRFLGD